MPYDELQELMEEMQVEKARAQGIDLAAQEAIAEEKRQERAELGAQKMLWDPAGGLHRKGRYPGLDFLQDMGAVDPTSKMGVVDPGILTAGGRRVWGAIQDLAKSQKAKSAAGLPGKGNWETLANYLRHGKVKPETSKRIIEEIGHVKEPKVLRGQAMHAVGYFDPSVAQEMSEAISKQPLEDVLMSHVKGGPQPLKGIEASDELAKLATKEIDDEFLDASDVDQYYRAQKTLPEENLKNVRVTRYSPKQHRELENFNPSSFEYERLLTALKGKGMATPKPALDISSLPRVTEGPDPRFLTNLLSQMHYDLEKTMKPSESPGALELFLEGKWKNTYLEDLLEQHGIDKETLLKHHKFLNEVD